MGLGDPKYKKNHSYIIENFHGGDGYINRNERCIYKKGYLCSKEDCEFYKKTCKDFKCAKYVIDVKNLINKELKWSSEKLTKEAILKLKKN